MRPLFQFVFGLLCFGALGLTAAHFYVASGDYKDRIELEATKALGRDVSISEVTSAGLLPFPKVEVTELKIANAPDMTDAQFASVERASIGVKLLPLLSRNIEISNFDLDAPEVYLEKRRNGDVNWILGNADTEQSEQNAEGPVAINDLRLGTIKISDGKIIYRDRVSNQTFTAEKANISLTLNSLDAPLSVSGDMNFQGAPATLTAGLSTPRALMEKKASQLSLVFAVDNNRVDTDINIAAGDLAYDGTLDIDAPSLKSLLRTLGMPLEVGTGFNNLTIKGAVKGNATQMQFSDALVVFDQTRTSNANSGQTDITFNWAGNRPIVTGKIALEALDLRPYMPAPSAEALANKKDKDAAFPPWPTEQIDFSTMQAVDVDLSTTTNNIYLHGMAFGSSGLDLNITNGVLVASLQELNLYDGGGRGTLRVDSRPRFPVVELKDIQLTGMNAQTFATEVLGLNRIRGVGGLNASLTARGTTVADFMRTLNGSGSFDIDKGAVEGIDIGKIVRSAAALYQGFQNGAFDPTALTNAITEARGPASTTQFTNMKSRFTARNGVVNAENILMQGPYFMIEGDGNVNLPNQSMKMTFVPTVYETLEEATGRKLNLPLLISGTFNNPKVGFDTQGLLRNAAEDRLKDALKDRGLDVDDSQSLEDALKEKAQEELTKRLFGTPDGDAQSSTETSATDGENEDEPSLEEELTDALLGSIFGGKGKKD